MDGWIEAVLAGLGSDAELQVEGSRMDNVAKKLTIGLCVKNTHVRIEMRDSDVGSTQRTQYCKFTMYDKAECDDKNAFDIPEECRVADSSVRIDFLSAQSILQSMKSELISFVDWRIRAYVGLSNAGFKARFATEKRADWEYIVSFKFTFEDRHVLRLETSMKVVGYWIRIGLNFDWNVSDIMYKLVKKLRIRYPLKQDEFLDVISIIKSLAKPYAVTPIRRQVSAALADWCPAVLESLRKEWTILINVGDACMEDRSTLFAPLVLYGGGYFVNAGVIHDVPVELRIRRLSNLHYEYTVLRVSSYMTRVAFAPDAVDGVDMDTIIQNMKLIALDLVSCNIQKERKDFESLICAGLIRAGFWTFTDNETLGFFSDNREGYFIDRDKNRYKIKYEDHSSFIYSFVLTSMDGLSTPKKCDNVFGARNFSESVVKYTTEFRTFCTEKKKRNDNPGYSSATMKILDKLTGYLVRFQRVWESSQSKGIKFDDEQLVPLREALNHLSELITKRT